MKIVLIRHGVAEDREQFTRTGKGDAERPLTKAGRRKMRRAAHGLLSELPKIDLLASSPLRRAVQTAEIIRDVYGGLRIVQIAPLSPRKPVSALLHWLQAQPATTTVALVGHEPHLGVFASWALTGLQESIIPLKKGGACLIEFDRDVQAGHGQLHWLLRPRQLRAIGR